MNGKFKFHRIHRNMNANYIGASVIFNVHNAGNSIKIYIQMCKKHCSFSKRDNHLIIKLLIIQLITPCPAC